MAPSKASTAAALPDSGGWIVSTSLEKPDQDTRRYIRSHVMRGKNTRADRRSRKVVAAKKKQSLTPSDDSGEDLKDEDSIVQWRVPASDTPSKDRDCVVQAPRKVASEIHAFGVDVDMKPYMMDLIYRTFTFIKPSMSTVEDQLAGRHMQDTFCFTGLAETPAMVHSMIFTAQAFQDHHMTKMAKTGQVAGYHLSQTLSILQQSLNDESTATAQSTMSVVMSLAVAALFLGDIGSASKHMDGLFQMIHLAGGMDTVQRGSLIEHKTRRMDFGLALASGNPMRFVRGEICWSLHPSIAESKKATRFPELSAVQPRPDPKLLNIWADLRAFAAAANEATQSGTKMPPGLYADITQSAPVRLTHLSEFELGSPHELLRLCMMAFLKNILASFVGVSRLMTYLSSRLKACLLALHSTAHAPELDELLFWAGMVAAVAIFDEFDDQEWIRDLLRQQAAALDLQSWEEARDVLKGFLWIDLVFDSSAEDLYREWIVGERKPSLDGRREDCMEA